MGGLSIWHWLVVLLVVMLLFGGSKVSNLMGDFAKGIKAFKKNMADDEDASMAANTDRPAGNIAGPGVNQSASGAQQPTGAPRQG
jgi:sec-independent protein translocase protein TatA